MASKKKKEEDVSASKNEIGNGNLAFLNNEKIISRAKVIMENTLGYK